MKKRPNILAVCYRFDSGGAETLAATIIKHLRTKKHNIFCCATNSVDGSMKTHLESYSIPCYGLDFDHKNRVTRFLAVLLLLKKLNIDTLYIQHFTMFSHFYWPAKLLGIKNIIVTEHSSANYIDDSKLVKHVKNKAHIISAVTLVHERIVDFFSTALNYNNKNIHVIPNGIDTKLFSPGNTTYQHKDIGTSSDNFIIGCVARLHDLKDHQNLLHAIHIVKNELKYNIDNLRIVLVGDGDLRGNLENLSSTLGLSENIIFLGDRNDVDQIMPLFNLFVLPSKSEGFPIVLLEAMSCAIPCIATDVGGISLLFTKGGGSVVPAENASALAKQIFNYLLLSEPEFTSLGKEAREIILSNYSDQKMLDAYEQVILRPAK